jgi:hypothetical protein
VAEPLRGLFATKDLSNGTIGEFHKISTALERGKIEAVFTNEEVLLCEVWDQNKNKGIYN